ncbi:hypothetical protein [Bradyrhizobium sp. CCBAU 25338]|uniref:hypothetical protein n=1 Tax=Bradyrhizobium sp. CCBAU 25338 TaxID=1641877 RepID=UPI002303BEF8|nr:hypothetical protein [Bradyrhizobium sp. CCBAU 25338]
MAQSTRQSEMEAPPAESEPLVRTEAGVRNLASAVEHILKQRDIEQLNLVAMSWGGSVANAYTAGKRQSRKARARRAPLVLKGPVPVDASGRLGSCRKVPFMDFRAGLLSAAPRAARSSLIPAGGFQLWANISLATDPQGN